ncbi:MAG TPA: IPT/TIG domain-containing protein [Solirubrobacteraceae bacterium]
MDRGCARAPQGARTDGGRSAPIAEATPAAGPRRFRCALLTLAVALMLGVGASGASAVIVQLPNGKTVSYQPLRGSAGALRAQPFAGSNLAFHGGPVMTSNTNYTFYWAPSGSPAYAAGYQSGVNQYMEDLAHDSGGNQNVDSVATQYTNSASEPVAYKSHFAGQIIDTNPYPKSGCKAATICLTDAQIQTEIKSWVTAHSLPHDVTHEYFLLTPPGVESCFSSAGTQCSAGTTAPAFCAYHGAISDAGGPIIYANDPYVLGVSGCDSSEHPNNSPSDSALLGGLSHEHNESITDPELNAWFGPEGNENGDKCRTFVESSEYGEALGTAPDGSRYNQLINGREYFYQQEWSNEGSTCLQRPGAVLTPPAVKKLAPKTGPAAGGTSVTITGTGFTGSTAVKFGSTAAVSFKVESPTTIAAIAPAGSSGTVDVTVSTPGGTSPVVVADHFNYGAPVVTGVSPNAGSKAGGTAVSISGSGFALGSTTTFLFGKLAATSVNCTSSSSCTAVSPGATKASTVDVVAKVLSVKSKKNAPADHFSYS